jgi:protein-S-isoprenylcysteine O-methyltransferase Ste14
MNGDDVMTGAAKSPVTHKPRLDKYGINAVARHLSMAVIVAALLFVGAGTFGWRWGWVFSIVNCLGWVGLSAALVQWNPGLLNQRGNRTSHMEGTKQWDWVLLSLYSVLIVAQPFVAGLDYRYGWSAPVADWVCVAGNGLTLIALALLAWSMVANRFFEVTVRIQAQRGQAVVTAGPYRYVRHPGYVGVILMFVSLPLALGTWAALIPGALGVVIYVIRTALEDRTLQVELSGYAEYARRTRYRLVPGVW